MQVRMILEGLSPGMEHREEADPRAEVPGVGRDLEQGLRGRPKQQPVDEPLVLERERAPVAPGA